MISNGYDEEVFQQAERSIVRSLAPGAEFRLVHSGTVYPNERDPTQLFQAIARLKAKGGLSATRLRVTLRATANDEILRRDLRALGIEDIVRLEPAIDYLKALEEMMSADGLLLLQGSNCNAQIPAKLYEYLRADRPILALTDPEGDMARTLAAAGVGLIARLDSAADIESALVVLMQQIQAGTWRRPSHQTIARYSREAQAQQLGELLTQSNLETKA